LGSGSREANLAASQSVYLMDKGMKEMSHKDFSRLPVPSVNLETLNLKA
jgi:hypothetical protein